MEDFKSVIFHSKMEDVLKQMPDNSIDLICTDPPYGTNFKSSQFYNDSKEYVEENIDFWLEEMSRVLKEKGHTYIFIPTLISEIWISHVKKHFKFNNLLAFQSFFKKGYFKNNFGFDLQLIIYDSKGTAKRLNKVDWIPTSKSWFKDKRNKDPKKWSYQYKSFIPHYKANVKSNGYSKKLHPNQKSVGLIEKFILLSSKENEVVLDPFAGSGSTLIAAKNINRYYIGIESNKEFFDISKERLR